VGCGPQAIGVLIVGVAVGPSCVYVGYGQLTVIDGVLRLLLPRFSKLLLRNVHWRVLARNTRIPVVLFVEVHENGGCEDI